LASPLSSAALWRMAAMCAFWESTDMALNPASQA
jgi:hypothetical protein